MSSEKTITTRNCCHYCHFFKPIITFADEGSGDYKGVNIRNSRGGNCRYNPPVISPSGLTLFPYVPRENWCGKFKINTFLPDDSYERIQLK